MKLEDFLKIFTEENGFDGFIDCEGMDVVIDGYISKEKLVKILGGFKT